MSKDKIKQILIDLLFEEEKEDNIKTTDYKKEILFWATCGTMFASINASGAMNNIRPTAATICFGMLSYEAIRAIKTGKLVKDFKKIASKRQYRKVK
jgi:hypothetical protein